jgi:phage tail-like protein
VRAHLPGLTSPYPLGHALPAIFQDDDFTQRWLAGLDEVLAPVFCTLDNIDSYFDPQLAPDDFVSWLASWVGLVVDETWTVERRRQLVAEAAELYRLRGTAKGLAAHVAAFTGVMPEVIESGGAGWSASPDGAMPGDDSCSVTVRVAAAAGAIDVERLDRIVAAAKPAHVVHTVELVATP